MKNFWISPPKFNGHNSKKILQIYSSMLYGLLGSTTRCEPNVSKTVEKLAYQLDMQSVLCQKKENLAVLYLQMFYDILSLRDALSLQQKADIDMSLKIVSEDAEVLRKTLGVMNANSPYESEMSKYVISFLTKKEAINSIYRIAQKDLERGKGKLRLIRQAIKECTNGKEKERLFFEEKRLIAKVNKRIKITGTINAVLNSLDDLSEDAKLSPKLARSIDKKIKVNRLSDFISDYDKWLSEIQTISTFISNINGNVVRADKSAEDFTDMLYENESEVEADDMLLDDSVDEERLNLKPLKPVDEMEADKEKENNNLKEN